LLASPATQEVLVPRSVTTANSTNRAEAWAAAYWADRVDARLAGVADAEDRADLRMFFEERAGICEFDGGLSRFAAERAAFELLADRVDARPPKPPAD
jgi:hypothetical protein